MRRFVEEDLTGAEFRECELDGARSERVQAFARVLPGDFRADGQDHI